MKLDDPLIVCTLFHQVYLISVCQMHFYCSLLHVNIYYQVFIGSYVNLISVVFILV
jgi:hypothetical protein